MADPDFAKGASPSPGYDTTPGGLGLSPAYLGGATATATGSGSSGAAVGWSDIPGTLAYSSADGPTGVVTTSTDLTGTISVGARVRLTQTTAKYFIVTAISASTMTLYGGTDYTLANAAITVPSYSLAKAPVGFLVDPLKWTEQFKDTGARSQAAAAAGTWYNIGSSLLSVPIGAWSVEYFVDASPVTAVPIYTTLSTANNSESDVDFSMRFFAGAGATGGAQATLARRKNLLLAAKTTYFLNAKTSSGAAPTLGFDGNDSPTIIRAVCAYL